MHYGYGDNYNRGDYYQGDYYQGDPGLLGFLKKGFTALTRAGLAVAGGGIPSAAAGAAALFGGSKSKALKRLGNIAISANPLIQSYDSAVAAGGAAALPPAPGGNIAMLGGGPPGTSMVPYGGGGIMPAFSGGGMVPRGYHLNKSMYARGGRLHSHGNLEIVPAHTTLVRNRRMNWGNSRALVRAERRIGAFVRHATKLIKWVHPHKQGHAVPKIRGRKK